MTEPPDESAARDASGALLLIDVINSFDFDGAERMLGRAEEAAGRIAALKDRARRAGLPVVYCNDHFGQWRENFRELVERCARDDAPGHRIVRMLRPDDDDYFVLKPKHSAFFETSLPILLQRLGANTLILTGFAGDICVLATALDAHQRELDLIIPPDCTASERSADRDQAMAYVRRVLGARTPDSEEIDLEALAPPG